MRWLASAALIAAVTAFGYVIPAGAIEVSLECSADFYASGDSVFFTWTNDTDSTIVAGNHPPYDIYHAETGELVCMYAFPMEYHLGPHQVAYLFWDQIDCEGNIVPPGRYIVQIWFVIEVPPPYFLVEDDFIILDTASAPEEGPVSRQTSWGRIRSTFR